MADLSQRLQCIARRLRIQQINRQIAHLRPVHTPAARQADHLPPLHDQFFNQFMADNAIGADDQRQFAALHVASPVHYGYSYCDRLVKLAVGAIFN
ncbi:hypothetical protein D3C79_923490 [compost metagenome]